MRAVLCLYVLLLAASAALADAPLPPPSTVTRCNATRSFCATSDPFSANTVVRSTGSGKPTWSVARYFRFFALSSDGSALVALSDFGNLAPLDATSETELFSIYRNGQLLTVVRVGDLFASPSEMPRTSSHRAWGNLARTTTEDSAVFKLSSGVEVSYSLRTGLKVAPHEGT